MILQIFIEELISTRILDLYFFHRRDIKLFDEDLDGPMKTSSDKVQVTACGQ